MRQRRPALLSWLLQHVCPDAGLDAACPAEEEGEPRRIIGFLLHTHAITLTGMKDETRADCKLQQWRAMLDWSALQPGLGRMLRVAAVPMLSHF